MKPILMWTPAKIAQLLGASDKAVERAMLAIYARHVQDEKGARHGRQVNDRGFRAIDVAKGSYYARWVLRGHKLTGYHLYNARNIALHYTAQLADEANAKVTRTFRTHPRGTFDSERLMQVVRLDNARANPPGKDDGEVAVTGVSYAHTARMLVELGLMTGAEADAWKDNMKEGVL